MKYTKFSASLASVAVGASLLAGVALPAFAEQGERIRTASSSPMKNKAMEQKEATKEMKARLLASTTAARLANKNQATIVRLKAKAEQEVDRRTKSLTELNTRVQAMVKVSAEQKASISAMIQAEIQNLATLKAKIAAETNIEILTVDVKSINDSHRVYALVMPQIQIIAAADRLSTTADMMAALGVKLQARITEAQTAGKDVTAAQAALTSLIAKVAEANVQAQAAISAIISLTPDGGDKAKAEANRSALQGVRKTLNTGEQSLKAARKEAEKITKSLKAGLRVDMKLKASATSTDSR